MVTRMECAECDTTMVARMATAEEPYSYDITGLPVQLAGIEVLRCTGCGRQYPIVPRLPELHQVIAQMLSRKPSRLLGQQVRFIRKQFGLPGYRFAILLDIDPSHLSRVENGHVKLGPTAERMVRLIGAKAGVGETARDALIALANELHERKKKRAVRPRSSLFSLNRTGWKAVA